MPVWRERWRILLWPYLWYTGFGLLVTAAVLLTNLALVIQAVLGGLRLGEFYPEADVQTQFGMNAYQAVRAVERAVDAHLEREVPEREVPAGVVPERAGRVAAPVPRDQIRFDRVTFNYPAAIWSPSATVRSGQISGWRSSGRRSAPPAARCRRPRPRPRFPGSSRPARLRC
jgi:hypothetical protein